MKILILENDADLYDGHPFTYWVERQKELGHEIKMINNAYHSGEEIVKNINWPDRVAFTSTFIYIHSIYELSLAIAKYRKAPLEMWIMNDTLPGEINRLIEMHAEVPKFVENVFNKRTGEEEPLYEWVIDEDKAEQYGYAMRNIVISQLEYRSYNHTESTRLMHTLHGLGLKWQMKLDEDKDFLLSRSQPEALTGRMIRIKPGILKSAPGEKWSELKPGMIVPEISMLGASERLEKGQYKDRGAWVMGKGEPVKILNDNPGFGSAKYDEFEYVIRNVDDCIMEILKMCGQEINSKNYHYVMGVLKDDSEEMTPHWKATEILDTFEQPRRGNRAIMEQRIEEFEKLESKASALRD